MSTFDAANIESTSGGAPSFSQGLNVGGSSITTLITLTEYYSQAEEPSSPANGAVWWDGTDAYQYVGGLWRILSVTPPPVWYGSRGLFGGGSTGSSSNVIDYVTISTTGNAVDFGDLTVARSGLGSCSDGAKGLFGGGSTGSYSDTIDYVTIATTGNAVDFGDLTVARSGVAACSDGIKGLFGGGFTGSNSNVIDYVTIATTGNAVDFGDLTVARGELASCSDATYGLFGGGVSATNFQNVIDYVTIATTGNATDFGDLSPDPFWSDAYRSDLAACSDTTRGVFGGGYSNIGFGMRVIDYVTIATPGNATFFGLLPDSGAGYDDSAYDLSACSDATYGLFGGGQDISSPTNQISYITIATTGNAADFGDLTVARSALAACSGD